LILRKKHRAPLPRIQEKASNIFANSSIRDEKKKEQRKGEEAV